MGVAIDDFNGRKIKCINTNVLSMKIEPGGMSFSSAGKKNEFAVSVWQPVRL